MYLLTNPLARVQVSRSKFSIPRVRPRTPSTFSRQSPLSNSPRSISFNDSPTTSEFSRVSNVSSPRPSTSLSSNSHEFVHPYANPDLVVTYAQEPPTSPLRTGAMFANIVRSDSISTITESNSTSSHSTLTHMASVSSLRQSSLSSPRVSNLMAKEISLPLRPNDLSADKNRELKIMARPVALGPNGIPGWMDNPSSPTIQLISLAEAQAQAKERARGTTINGGEVPFQEPDQNSSPTGNIPMRSRARSISAGAKAKSALHNMVGGPSPPKLDKGDSDSSLSTYGVPGKSLKHKKSGFMRLFNGKEKEAVPPVPTLSDAYTAHSNSQASVPRTTKMMVPRVPVPILLPSAMDESTFTSSTSSVAADFGSLPTARQTHPSPKRIPPSLSIITSHSPRSPATNLSLPTTATKLQEDGRLLSSAPPSTTNFPSLSLRPVSTIFSAHFADHIVPQEVESPVDAEQSLDTPSSISPNTGRSPVTPGFSVRSDGSSGD